MFKQHSPYDIPKILPRVAARCKASRLQTTASLRIASLAASLLSNSMADTLREPFVEREGSLRGADSTVSMESQQHVNTRRHSFTPTFMKQPLTLQDCSKIVFQ